MISSPVSVFDFDPVMLTTKTTKAITIAIANVTDHIRTAATLWTHCGDGLLI
jgi:hypothetical protein